MRKSSIVTTRELEHLVTAITAFCAQRCRLDCVRRPHWRAWRNDLVARLHGVMKPSARPYAGKVLAGMVNDLLVELAAAWRWADELAATCNALTRELAAARQQCADLQHQQEQTAFQVARLTDELAQVQAELARRTVPKAVVLPGQTIAVTSPLQREVLRLIADEGVGRVWRIAARLVGGGACATENSVRNAIQKLTEKGLIEDYQQHGQRVAWTLKAGGQRRLITLSEAGRLWCRGAFGREPVASEIAAAARQHKSVAHGVAVLEARDLLRSFGVVVDDDPTVLLATAERWGARAEPDLLMMLPDGLWPVEVQREVSHRRTDKWAKALRLAGRLALILFSEEAANKQARILWGALSALPAGTIRLSSLETLEKGRCAWQEIVVPLRR